jgi:hypothetical protein
MAILNRNILMKNFRKIRIEGGLDKGPGSRSQELELETLAASQAAVSKKGF